MWQETVTLSRRRTPGSIPGSPTIIFNIPYYSINVDEVLKIDCRESFPLLSVNLKITHEKHTLLTHHRRPFG